MGQPEILRKVDRLLKTHTSLTEESEVVYLFVEIRKFLDQMEDGGRGYELLRFYCDWIVHSAKDRHLQHIAPILDNAYALVCAALKEGGNEPNRELPAYIVQFGDLRAQLAAFLAVWHVTTQTIEDDKSWSVLVGLLVRVLVDQPLVSPTRAIAKFAFVGSGPFYGLIEFAEPIANRSGKPCEAYRFELPKL